MSNLDRNNYVGTETNTCCKYFLFANAPLQKPGIKRNLKPVKAVTECFGPEKIPIWTMINIWRGIDESDEFVRRINV